MRQLKSEAVRPYGAGLHRPECVVGAPSGDVYFSDWRGGVGVIRADGRQQSWLADRPVIDFKPNGIVPTARGSFLIANLGDDGGVWELTTDGGLAPVLADLAGEPLPPANFVFIGEDERIWITVSTRKRPRQEAWRPDIADGFIVLIDKGKASIAADGLHYTNEARIDPSGRHLYVVETFGKRLIRFELKSGVLSDKAELVAGFGAGFFPDGFAFDAEGGIWVTSLISNQVVRIDGDGVQTVVLSDTNPGFASQAQAAFNSHRMTKDHLGPIAEVRYQHLTSIAFGGPDGRSAWLGCLHGDTIFRFDSPVAGAPCPHWSYRLP